MASLFVVVFAVLWRRRGHPYLAMLALGFLASAVAFAVQDVILTQGEDVSRLIVNGLFTVAIACIAAAALSRAGIAVPIRTFAAVAILGMAALAFFLYGDPNLAARIMVVNVTLGVIALITLWRLVRAGPRGTTDWLIVAIAASALALSALRLILAPFDDYDVVTYDGFQQSVYWTTIQLFAAIFSVAIAMAFVLSAAQEMMAKLRAEADIDHLSGLLNRRGFEAAAERILSGASDGASHAILLADLDDFKQVNDTFGHAAGDNVIAAVGRILAEHGQTRAVGRIGGEEFALLYAGMRRSELHAIATRLQVELDHRPIAGLPRDYRVTISIGIFESGEEQTLSSMLAGADRALYTAKHTGKNRVELAAPSYLRAV